MTDMKLWSEAKDIAKDQLRHGKVHYSDLMKATKTIYDDLLQMENGPVIDAEIIDSKPAQAALPASSGSKFKHEIVNGMVRCAECGKLLKTLSANHLGQHDISRQGYMTKHAVSEKDMQGKIDRSKVKKGEDNALKIMSYIMKAYDIKRGEVKSFVVKHGFEDIKDLMAQAKEKGVAALDLLKKKALLPKEGAE